MTVDLPWPAKVLHPNARPHWAVKARATRKARSDALICATISGLAPIVAERLSVTATFSPPDNRRRDQDGMLSSIKAYFDAISEVVGIDDHKWDIAIKTAAPVKGGNVNISITPIEGKS